MLTKETFHFIVHAAFSFLEEFQHGNRIANALRWSRDDVLIGPTTSGRTNGVRYLDAHFSFLDQHAMRPTIGGAN